MDHTPERDDREEFHIKYYERHLSELPAELRQKTEYEMRQTYRAWRQREDQLEKNTDFSKKEGIIDLQNRSENLDINLWGHIFAARQQIAKYQQSNLTKPPSKNDRSEALKVRGVQNLKARLTQKARSRDNDRGGRER